MGATVWLPNMRLAAALSLELLLSPSESRLMAPCSARHSLYCSVLYCAVLYCVLRHGGVRGAGAGPLLSSSLLLSRHRGSGWPAHSCHISCSCHGPVTLPIHTTLYTAHCTSTIYNIQYTIYITSYRIPNSNGHGQCHCLSAFPALPIA